MTLSPTLRRQLQDLLDNIALRTVGVGEHANPISADQYWRDLREAGHAAFHLRDTEIETAVKQFRMDALGAVMLSVDKWFNYDDPRLQNNPETRAADAREIALQAIEKLAERALKAEADVERLTHKKLICPMIAETIEDMTFARDSHLKWAEHLEAHAASGESCQACDDRPYKLNAVNEREWVTKYDNVLKQLRRIETAEALLTSLQSAQEQRDAKMLAEIDAVWTLNSENEPQAFTDAIIAIRKLLRPPSPQEPT